MIIRKYVDEITNLLIGYVAKIDSFVRERAHLVQKLDEEVKRMEGKYTPEYIEEYAKKYQFPNYLARMNTERADCRELVDYYLETIEKQLDSYFTAPVRTDFANKLNSTKIIGLKLSDREFEVLAKSARSYMEIRLLNHLAETRTDLHTETVLDHQTKKPKFENKEVASPYMCINTPSLEICYDAFKAFKTHVIFLLDNYCGAKAELTEYLENKAPAYISINADTYFKNKEADKFLKVMEEQGDILKKSGVKRELTERDKKVIDALINEPFPELYKDKVKERVKLIAAGMPEIGMLLRLDERYNKYLD